MKPKYPNVHVQLTPRRNAFVALTDVLMEMRRAGVPKLEREAYQAEALSDDYDHVVRTSTRWVRLSGVEFRPQTQTMTRRYR